MMYPVLLLILLLLLCIENDSYSINKKYSRNIERLQKKQEKKNNS